MNVGARVLKTGVAVTLALYLCKLLHIEPAIFAAISVVVNMQPSVHKALKNAWEQVGVHILGVGLALILGLTLGTNPIVMGVATILIILICNRLGWSGGITVGVVSIVFILDSPSEQFLFHAGIRSLAVLLGLVVALVVNRVLMPPEYKKKLYTQVESLFKDASAYFLDSIITFISSSSLPTFTARKPGELIERLEEVTNLYEHARVEFGNRDNPQLVERLLEICRGLIERADNIEEMTALRVQRRNSTDSPLAGEGVSPEFQVILDILKEGEYRLSFWAKKVTIGLNQPHPPEGAREDTEYWAVFDQAIEVWQSKVSGFFYLRAMMEIAVVATELRWAAKRLKGVYDLGHFTS